MCSIKIDMTIQGFSNQVGFTILEEHDSSPSYEEKYAESLSLLDGILKNDLFATISWKWSARYISERERMSRQVQGPTDKLSAWAKHGRIEPQRAQRVLSYFYQDPKEVALIRMTHRRKPNHS